MSLPLLRRLRPEEVATDRRDAVDREALASAAMIIADVRERGESALRAQAERLGDLEPGAALVRTRAELDAALAATDRSDREVLERTAARIRAFAEAQMGALGTVAVSVPGGEAGSHLAPVARAGCYAPGGRFPLPSSVLMTAVTARVAGVASVWVASPRPAAITLAAAAVAGADALLAVGGAQAIAALAFGAGPVPPCDAVVGPGNRWVTAAKQLVAGRVAIDMLAGPSELVVIADGDADAALIAADLLAQAEHDPEALPVLLTTSTDLADRVQAELARQLANLPAPATAQMALANGFVVVTRDLQAAAAVCDRMAPEHVALHVAQPAKLATSLHNYGALFLGAGSAEVLGDYGAGPNHVLPTGSTARSTGALSVLSFLRVQTWLAITDTKAAAPLIADAIQLARLEGLEAHARSAHARGLT